MSGKKLTLVFVIGGDEFSVEANPNSPLKAARNIALGMSKDEGGREPDEWDVKDSSGKVLDVNEKIEKFNFSSGDKLYLTPKVSGGGS